MRFSGLIPALLAVWLCPGCVWLYEPPPFLDFLTNPAENDFMNETDWLDPLFEASAGATAVALGDINNDGLTDMASVWYESQPVQIHLRNAQTGKFEQIAIRGAAPLTIMSVVRLADLNADGKLDIIVLVDDTGYTPPPNVAKIGALVLLIQGADPAEPADWRQVDAILQVDGQVNCFADHSVPACDMFFYNDAGGISDLAVADFNGDGLPDLAVASNEPDDNKYVYLFVNPGAADVPDPAHWNRVVIEQDAPDMARLAAADLDDDGDQDLLLSAPTAKSFNLRWLQNEANGTLWTRRLVGQQQDGGDFIALGDIDGDGYPDLAAASVTDKLVQWFRNPGPTGLASGAPQVPWEVFNIADLSSVEINGKNTSTEINQLQLVDLNGDGELECYATGSGSAFELRRTNNIEDLWQTDPLFTTDPPATIGYSAFLDIDDDGSLDIIVPLDTPGLANDRIRVIYR